MTLAGRTALVTGGSRGIGRTLAVELARAGAWVAIGYRQREAEARQTLAELHADGGEGDVFAADVRDYAAVEALVGRVLAVRPAIDVLVCCAGVTRDNWFARSTPEEWEDVLRTDLHGCLHAARAVTRPMLGAGGGAIVNVGSVAGVRASPGQASYAAAKAGVLALTASLAAELGPKGIRVNAVVPGLIDAGMVRRTDPREIARRLPHIPLGRLGEAREVARAVLFLASDEASYITGQALVVDGGLSL